MVCGPSGRPARPLAVKPPEESVPHTKISTQPSPTSAPPPAPSSDHATLPARLSGSLAANWKPSASPPTNAGMLPERLSPGGVGSSRVIVPVAKLTLLALLVARAIGVVVLL